MSSETATIQFNTNTDFASIETWKRKPIKSLNPGFFVEILVEGYQPFKNTWIHEKRHFETLVDAVNFCREISTKPYGEFDKWMDAEYKGYGWYNITLEGLRIFEVAADGAKFEWEKSF